MMGDLLLGRIAAGTPITAGTPMAAGTPTIPATPVIRATPILYGTPRIRTPRIGGIPSLGVLLIVTGGLVPPLSAQQDTLPVATGVELGMAYSVQIPRTLVVRAFRGPDPAGAAWALAVRDLELSDRFRVLDAPPALSAGPPELGVWDGLGIDFLVDAEVGGDSGARVLRLTVYDVLYARVLAQGALPLPPADSPNFRMAVHAASDSVVRWTTGDPGMAASRVAFLRRRTDGGRDLMVVDSDGEGLRRVVRLETLAFSPVWSPDGGRIVYTQMGSDGSYRVHERTLATGATREIHTGPGLPLTPAYAPDGTRLAVAVSTGPREDVDEYDFTGGRVRRTQSRALAPAYSPDGRYLAFGSSRLGPYHVWVVPTDGGDPVLVSPFGDDTRTHFELPDWAPVGSLLAFHGGRSSSFQVLVVDMSDPRRRVHQITREGWSESPSWAPDGRHLVVHGARGGREGLWVLDTATGRTRLLVEGGDVRTPDWSPALDFEAATPSRNGRTHAP